LDDIRRIRLKKSKRKMAINIVSLPVGIYMQSGNGVPTHISPKGTEYTDLDTAIVYINKDGAAFWAEFLDSTFVITGGTSSYFTGGTVTGPTNFLNGVTANTISATTYYGLPTDVRVTGGTYSAGTILFTNNTGGTFTVTGLTTGGSGSTTVVQFTGGTVSGATIFTGGLSANTISATTYYNLPNDLPVSGTAGQILAKIDGTNYNVEWIDNYANWTSQLKHEVKAGEAINKGQAVYVSSANGTNIIVSKASNTTEATSSKTLGLLAQNLALNGQGFVITEGLLAGLNTGAANAGDAVWLGTNGNLIFGLLNKPVAPAHLVYLGVVTRAQTNNGEIFVRPQNGFELNEIHDVLITGVTNGDLISYNSSSSLWKNSKTLDGSYKVTGTLSATTISATTYLNLPIDIRQTGATYSNNNFTFTNNTGGTFNVLFNTVTGLTINGNTTVTGTTFLGNGTFTKSGYATGDILLDNNSNDSPGVLMYYANNNNYGLDTWNGSYDVLSGQLFRITNNLNESGGAVKMAIDTSGNIVVNGFVKTNAWRPGQTIQTKLFSAGDLSFNSNYTNSTNTYTSVVSGTYTPLSSSSYIFFEVYAMYFVDGASADSFFSQITWNGTEIGVQRQVWANGSGGGTRSGTLFPLAGRVTNGSTTGYGWAVNVRRDSSDDSITVYNNSGFYVKITEVAR